MSQTLTTEYEKKLWAFLSKPDPRLPNRLKMVGISKSSFYRYNKLANPISGLRYTQFKALVRLFETENNEVLA